VAEIGGKMYAVSGSNVAGGGGPLWNTLFRSFAGDEQAHGYFPTVARFGAVMAPDDM
jgi:hypothetical protein